MPKTICFLLFFSFNLMFACNNNYTKDNALVLNSTIENDESSSIIEEPFDTSNNIKYAVKIHRIDATTFYRIKATSHNQQNKLEKITDFTIAKEMLQNIVTFKENDEDGESHAIQKISFKNGKELVLNNDYDYTYFVAYFPTEQILLAEGGHTTDISFNLVTGETTENTGNPSYILSSPTQMYRVNGHFNGQECSSYFIQKKIHNQYKKIIQLDQEFERQTTSWLCIMGDVFWENDATLYFCLVDSYGEIRNELAYYKVTII